MPVNKKNTTEMLSLRITVVDPPPDIIWALRVSAKLSGRGQAEISDDL